METAHTLRREDSHPLLIIGVEVNLRHHTLVIAIEHDSNT